MSPAAKGKGGSLMIELGDDEAATVVFSESRAGLKKKTRGLRLIRTWKTRGGHLLQAPVSQLSPGRRFFYRVQKFDADGKVTDKGRVCQLATPPRTATPFSFFIVGDHRTGHDEHKAVVGAMVKHFDRLEKLKAPTSGARLPSFVLNTGDMVGWSRATEWRRFFDIQKDLLCRLPVLPSKGNHEALPTVSVPMRHYRHLFNLSQTFYAVHWAAATIVVLDGNVATADERIRQRTWLKAVLDRVRGRGAIIVALHHTIYSSGSHGDTNRLKKEYAPIFVKYGVQLVVTGHDHHYERTKPINGVTYVVSGGGGAPLRDVDATARNYAEGRKAYHYLYMEVDAYGTISGRAIEVSKSGATSEIDAFKIPAPNAPKKRRDTSGAREATQPVARGR